jgi:hypothetical protein
MTEERCNQRSELATPRGVDALFHKQAFSSVDALTPRRRFHFPIRQFLWGCQQRYNRPRRCYLTATNDVGVLFLQ